MEEQERLRQKITLRYAPLLDMALSLLVIQEPERFGRAAPWAEPVAARLPAGLLERLQAIGEQHDLFALALELEEGPPLPAPEALGRLAQRDPDLGGALLAYWAAVAPEVAAQSAVAVASMQQEAARLAEMDPLAFISRFSDRISVAGDGSSIILHWGQGMRVPLADLERILFVPAVFCPRRLMFYRLGPVQIFFYSPTRQLPAALAEAPERLTLGFAALADGTRLKLLRLIAREALPAQEMARRLGVNDSTVSRHLRLLVEAGLIYRARQDGKYVFYSFQAERLDELVTGARTYLAEPEI